MKKFFALLLAVLMLFSVVACAQEAIEPTSKETKKKDHPIAEVPDKGNDSDEEVIDDSKANYWVDLVVDSQPQYTVVSEGADFDVAAQTLVDGLYANTGVKFPIKKSTSTKAVSGNKISVGRSPSVVMQYLGGVKNLTYAGNVSHTPDHGATIYLTGHTKNAVGDTVNRFLSGILLKYRQTDEDGNIQVKAPDIRLFFLYNPKNFYAKDHATLLGVDLSEYVVVVPYELSAVEEITVRTLLSEIGVNTGCVLERVTDKKSRAAHEIVLGKTNRPESQALYSNLAQGNYALKSVDGSLYVAYENYLSIVSARSAINAAYLNDPITIQQTAKAEYSAPNLNKENNSYVRIMTSNIVCGADDGAKQNYDINGINCDLRVQIQGEMIMEYLPDFVGLQEMQESTLYGVKALMRTELLKVTGEEYDFVQYSNISTADYWNPILYRKTVWQIEEKEASEPFDSGMHRWQWALFSKIDDPTQKCIVMNLHYPTSSNANQQMTAAQIVNAQIKILQQEHSGVPVFVTGDFNSRPGSAPYETSFEGTGLVTANPDAKAIDHVIYDPSLVSKQAGAAIVDEWIALTSDHRPYFADVSLG